ncbi:hypothetical protein [Phenylobacterium sp.]|uniref:hypothetical protein n=1 Tax=Phenylobacterium sp. TaxID=1871053 RepID=UPI003562A79F
MRQLLAATTLLALAAAAPARADTLTEITTHGMIVTIAGMDYDLVFTPDGKFTSAAVQMTGTWKVDGDKLCTTNNFDPTEQCAAYPKDKKSGDTFELVTPQGSATVKIK